MDNSWDTITTLPELYNHILSQHFGKNIFFIEEFLPFQGYRIIYLNDIKTFFRINENVKSKNTFRMIYKIGFADYKLQSILVHIFDDNFKPIFQVNFGNNFIYFTPKMSIEEMLEKFKIKRQSTLVERMAFLFNKSITYNSKTKEVKVFGEPWVPNHTILLNKRVFENIPFLYYSILIKTPWWKMKMKKDQNELYEELKNFLNPFFVKATDSKEHNNEL